MKVRIGFGPGGEDRRQHAGEFCAMVDAGERLGFDSLWLSERIGAANPDPVVGLAVAAGRTTRMKLGTSVMVLPGRNPVVVAKQLASLDLLSGDRLLPAFGLGVAEPNEQQGFGLHRPERAPWLDEALPLLRRLWSEASVDHDGPRFHFEHLVIEPKPARPLDVWLGGRAPSELRRAGRLADGWLASFVTPDQASRQRRAVEQAAAACGREIDPEHFGVVVIYLTSAGEAPAGLISRLRSRQPDVPLDEVCPTSTAALKRHIERFVDAGFSKFVLLPAARRAPWDVELEALAEVALVYQGDADAAASADFRN